jgi:hypothetical protein
VQDSAEWIRQQLQVAYNSVLASFPDAVGVQAPRTFTTGSGRPAVDHIIDYTLTDTPVRLRQVAFASDALDTAYILSFTAHRQAYGQHESTWRQAVDTFAIKEPTSSGWLIAALAGGLLALIVVAVLVAWRLRRKPGAAMPGVPPAPEGAGPPGPPPPGVPPPWSRPPPPPAGP